MKVVLVVDEPMVAKVTQTLLRRAAPALLAHACTAAAVETTLDEHGPFDAAILYRFPSVDGSAARAVRSMLPSDMPVVILIDGERSLVRKAAVQDASVEPVWRFASGEELVRGILHAVRRAAQRHATGAPRASGTGPTLPSSIAAALFRRYVWRAMADGASDRELADRLRAPQSAIVALRTELLSLLTAADRGDRLREIQDGDRM